MRFETREARKGAEEERKEAVAATTKRKLNSRQISRVIS